jgi:hypothetical protein
VNQGTTPASPSIIRSLLWDIALNATIPAALYLFAKHLIAASELSALLWATAFPLLKTAHDLVKRRDLDPVALLVLLGLVASMMAVLHRGDPRLLLVSSRLDVLVRTSSSRASRGSWRVELRPAFHRGTNG